MRTGRPKQPVVLSEEERARLESMAHRARSQALLARRARVVLACADGLDNQAVARKLRCSLGMVGKWRARFLKQRLEGLYLVEQWFAELTNKRIRRGAFRSVKELQSAIREFIEVHNENPKPFVWTRTADQILDRMARYACRTLASHPSGITSRITGTGD